MVCCTKRWPSADIRGQTLRENHTSSKCRSKLLPQSSCTSRLSLIFHPWSEGDKERVDAVSSSSGSRPFNKDPFDAVDHGAVKSSTQGIAYARIQLIGGFVIFDHNSSRILCMRHGRSDGHRPKLDFSVGATNLQPESIPADPLCESVVCTNDFLKLLFRDLQG